MSCLFVIGVQDLLSYHPLVCSLLVPSTTVACTFGCIFLKLTPNSSNAGASLRTFVARVHFLARSFFDLVQSTLYGAWLHCFHFELIVKAWMLFR